jgi:hypothetical protein
MIPFEAILAIILQVQTTACFGLGDPVGWYHTRGDEFVVQCSHGHSEKQYICDYEPAFCECGVLVRVK